jgi:GAF domain-containing protein
MADVTLSYDYPEDKADRYRVVTDEIAAIVAGEPYLPARLASAACVLKGAFGDRFFWCGFYVVDPQNSRELVVGPYQGTLGCLRIPFGKGVCGAAAATATTVLVPDVHAFPGHIACDSRSNSEIVVPVFDPAGRLIAVLDVDSTECDAFDSVDQAGLEAFCSAMMADWVPQTTTGWETADARA